VLHQGIAFTLEAEQRFHLAPDFLVRARLLKEPGPPIGRLLDGSEIEFLNGTPALGSEVHLLCVGCVPSTSRC
jgi:hypothetical protein